MVAVYKDEYQLELGKVAQFADALLQELNRHDVIETQNGAKSLYRIYRDVRFSKDKTPYNSHFGGSFKRANNKLRGGYYFHIEPGNSFVAGGFWGPNANDIKRIRQDIDLNYYDWQKLLQDSMFTETFGKLAGEQLTSAPRGYAKDHPAIELLRYKQFLVKVTFTDKEVCSPSFVSQANGIFKNMRPFFNFMSEVLTTDINGVPYED